MIEIDVRLLGWESGKGAACLPYDLRLEVVESYKEGDLIEIIEMVQDIKL